MLASCAKTTVVYNEAPEEISFKKVTNVMTKVETTLGDWKKSDMGVYAVKTGDQTNVYLNNAQFAKHGVNDYWSGGDGTTPKQYYWPFQGSLDFYVYAPYSANLAFDSSNNKLSATTFTNADYTNDNTYSGASAYNFNCVDLMYGASVVTGSKRDDALPVSLKHALAKVIVKVSASVANQNRVSLGQCPQSFWHQGSVSWKTVFPSVGVGDGVRTIQVHYIFGHFNLMVPLI